VILSLMQWPSFPSSFIGRCGHAVEPTYSMKETDWDRTMGGCGDRTMGGCGGSKCTIRVTS